MKIVLAGTNVDREALDEVLGAAPGRFDLTPETLSEAYAILKDAYPERHADVFGRPPKRVPPKIGK
ncbi:MAG: hypothetical protein NTW38_07540 [Candidatus Aminicenantes bacterium]|nr:hypothetical protein [Candidatus Aminicenantes bacterium]